MGSQGLGSKAAETTEMEDHDGVQEQVEEQETGEEVSGAGGQTEGAQDDGQQSSDEESGSDELIVSIGDETPPADDHAQAPGWVKELRKANREKEKRIRELEAKLSQVTEKKPVTLGPKPKLEDHDWDAEAFEQALDAWHERKRARDAEAELQQQAERQQWQAWQERIDGYTKAKAKMKVRDFEDAEEVAQMTLNVTQQGIILQGADNPAMVVYALGKNPTKAAELAKLNDPVKFAFAVAKLEKELKVTSRKPVAQPERAILGTARVSGSVDSRIDELRAQAEKTGDYSKVIAYKAQLKQKK